MNTTNRTSSQGQAPKSPQGRGSLKLRNVVPAGGSVPFPIAGSFFYVTAASGSIEVRPSGGDFTPYDVGTGLTFALENSFAQIEVRNPSAVNAVAFEIVYGFDTFIDNRVIIASNITQQVAYPTAPAVGAVNINIPDISGAPFTDINGNSWYAIAREGIYIGNTDAAATYLLQKFGSVVANGPAVAPIYPLTTLRYASAGNFCLNVGGGAINAIVSEIYFAIPKV